VDAMRGAGAGVAEWGGVLSMLCMLRSTVPGSMHASAVGQHAATARTEHSHQRSQACGLEFSLRNKEQSP
jgi:TRAP-type C4-dicarboxylate transport system permease large subunit